MANAQAATSREAATLLLSTTSFHSEGCSLLQGYTKGSIIIHLVGTTREHVSPPVNGCGESLLSLSAHGKRLGTSTQRNTPLTMRERRCLHPSCLWQGAVALGATTTIRPSTPGFHAGLRSKHQAGVANRVWCDCAQRVWPPPTQLRVRVTCTASCKVGVCGQQSH